MNRSSKSPSINARCIDRPRETDRPIHFGTSGWRGRLGEEVSFPRLRILTRSIAEWIHEQDRGREILIGWDGRLASRAMAEMAAAILFEAGLDPRLSACRTPTPAVTFALTKGRFAAGLVLTASHNPALDHGLKLFGPSGGTIDDAHARQIESIAMGRMRDDRPAAEYAPRFEDDFIVAYQKALASWLEPGALARSGVTVVYDAMHGAGGGVLDVVLESGGANLRRLRTTADPTFGGAAPDPIPARLESLSHEVSKIDGLALGLATDGDGDRFGAVDGTGRVLTETQVVALLVDHLASTGKISRGVAITAGTGSLVEKVAHAHGLKVERHPVGFKHLSAALAAGRVDVAGEESGGFALATMSLDKDGLLAGCLLANLVACSGKPLEDHVRQLESRFGASACGRAAIARTPRLDDALAAMAAGPPSRVGNLRVESVETERGLRLGLADGGFLILRRSGTEPMLRIYAEATSQAALEERLKQGSALIEQFASRL